MESSHPPLLVGGMADSQPATQALASPRTKRRLAETPHAHTAVEAPRGGDLAAAAAIVWLLGLAAVAGLYWNSFRELVEVWNNDPNYSHGFLVPVMSLGFAVL